MTIPTGLAEFENDLRWAVIKRKANEAKAVKAFNLFRAAGIEPILIKGLAAAANYPSDIFRDSIDMDLAVKAADIPAAVAVVVSDEATGLAIDLHDELRHLDPMPWSRVFAHSKPLVLDAGTIRVPCEEDHLRILCVHWLTDGGANHDRLRDIYYAVNNRPTSFDWDRVLNEVGERRRRWIVCAIGMASREFGMDLAGTPIETEAKELPEWFIRTIEKEWVDETKFRPLPHSMQDWQTFWKQLKKRLPPNPVTATILMNGSLDARSRVFYQVGTSIRRAGPSIIKSLETLWYKIR